MRCQSGWLSVCPAHINGTLLTSQWSHRTARTTVPSRPSPAGRQCFFAGWQPVDAAAPRVSVPQSRRLHSPGFPQVSPHHAGLLLLCQNEHPCWGNSRDTARKQVSPKFPPQCRTTQRRTTIAVTEPMSSLQKQFSFVSQDKHRSRDNIYHVRQLGLMMVAGTHCSRMWCAALVLLNCNSGG